MVFINITVIMAILLLRHAQGYSGNLELGVLNTLTKRKHGITVPYLINKLNLTSSRWSVFFRVLAALFGGYVLAISTSLFISQLLQQRGY
ncbi:hypothetical protein [Colwellia sp. TT2012]|uniref:hypothetical protein n=1 Tax=Colwellia sp. TT2012 TaxID=1720342 RepID=UPI000709187E|nr:hypothetical protein [Colwellia sp. TT2012]